MPTHCLCVHVHIRMRGFKWCVIGVVFHLCFSIQRAAGKCRRWKPDCRVHGEPSDGQGLKKGWMIRPSLYTELNQKRKTQAWRSPELCGSKIDLIRMAPVARRRVTKDNSLLCLFTQKHTCVWHTWLTVAASPKLPLLVCGRGLFV